MTARSSTRLGLSPQKGLPLHRRLSPGRVLREVRQVFVPAIKTTRKRLDRAYRYNAEIRECVLLPTIGVMMAVQNDVRVRQAEGSAFCDRKGTPNQMDKMDYAGKH